MKLVKLWEDLKAKKEIRICEGPEKCVIESEPRRAWFWKQLRRYASVFVAGLAFGILCAGMIVNNIYQQYWQGRSTIWLTQAEVQNILDARQLHAGDKYKLYEGMRADARDGKLRCEIDPQTAMPEDLTHKQAR